MKTSSLFFIGIVYMILLEVAKVYFIMPMPGSQETNTIDLAYWIHRNIWVLRGIGWALVAFPGYQLLTRPKRPWLRWLTVGLLAAYIYVGYLFNFSMLAEKMFYQPKTKRMVGLDRNKIPMNKLVLGIVRHDEARAYPIQLIGYHHQVRDTVGGEPVMITYCTVCRTGRAFSPLVGTQPDNFRLVGMDHFNAMFEDSRTGSWWQQATGKAITGPLKGQMLTELSTQHLTLQEWAALYPNTLVMQPDTTFNKQYDGMKNYDKGNGKNKLTRRDSLSWRDKSWVVGIVQNRSAKAYDWNGLLQTKVVNDVVGGNPVVLAVSTDSASFYAWNRQVDGQLLTFARLADGSLQDRETASVWNKQGLCLSGPNQGKKLQPIQAYQEFWHSWQTFHPSTGKAL